MPTMTNTSNPATNQPRAASISDAALLDLYQKCLAVRHGGMMGLILSPDHAAWQGQLAAKEAALRDLGRPGTRLDNTLLLQQLQQGDAVLYISGGGYVWYLGRLMYVEFIQVTDPENGDFAFAVGIRQSDCEVHFCTYPHARWWSAKDEFYLFQEASHGA